MFEGLFIKLQKRDVCVLHVDPLRITYSVRGNPHLPNTPYQNRWVLPSLMYEFMFNNIIHKQVCVAYGNTLFQMILASTRYILFCCLNKYVFVHVYFMRLFSCGILNYY